MAKYVYFNTSVDSNDEEADCIICKGKKKFTSWVKCDTCANWYHHRCLGIKVKDLEGVENYSCPTCLEGPNASSSPMEDGNEPDDNEANNTEHDTTMETDEEGNSEVDQILQWRPKGRGREFLVSFRSNGSTAWYLEKDLTDCSLLLENFCTQKRIALPAALKERRVGNISMAGANPNNWVEVEEIISAVKTHGHKESLLPEKFEQLGHSDAIKIMTLGNHCFVILYLAAKRTCLIADGQNAFIKDTRVRKAIMASLQEASLIHGIPFGQQKAIDYCGSSAAVIAIEFQRILRTNNIPKEVVTPTSTLRRIQDALHKEPSKKINPWTPVGNPNSYKARCENCGKVLNTRNRGALNLHKC